MADRMKLVIVFDKFCPVSLLNHFTKKFFINDIFSKCDQILHLLKKSLMENFILCVAKDFGKGNFLTFNRNMMLLTFGLPFESYRIGYTFIFRL